MLLEIWQADAAGRYDNPSFRGWGRTGTAFDTGLYGFETIKPGSVPGHHAGHPSAPHVVVWLVARGINVGLSTRIYFADEEALNERDPVLRTIDAAVRRATLIARREQHDGITVYVFDIRLQGGDETVFFDV